MTGTDCKSHWVILWISFLKSGITSIDAHFLTHQIPQLSQIKGCLVDHQVAADAAFFLAKKTAVQLVPLLNVHGWCEAREIPRRIQKQLQ
jgi:hypothetical protein